MYSLHRSLKNLSSNEVKKIFIKNAQNIKATTPTQNLIQAIASLVTIIELDFQHRSCNEPRLPISITTDELREFFAECNIHIK